MSHDYPPQSPYAVGLAGRCPRCGDGRLFSGFLTVRPHCENCGLDLAFADSGDGPAVFVTLLAGFLVMGLGLWVMLRFDPPFWVFLLIFIPLTIIVCMGMLRPLKGLLVALQYANKAGQGRLQGRQEDR